MTEANAPSDPAPALMSDLIRDYRLKIDTLHEARIATEASEALLSGAWKLGAKVCAAVLGGLGALCAYLWADFRITTAAVTSAETRVNAAVAELKALAAGVVVPVGTIVALPIPVPKPAPDSPQAGEWHYHWHACDGTSISQKDHAALAVMLGTTYGAASEVDKVKLPDFRGMFLRGEGTARDEEGTLRSDHISAAFGKPQWDALKNHFHDGVIQIVQGNKIFHPDNGQNGSSSRDATGSNEKDRTMNTIGGDKETRPANYAVTWIIRVR